MKEFTPEDIARTREFLQAQQYPVEEARIGELDISYWVIPQEKNPQLPDFALRLTHTDPQTGEVSGVFGVSDSVPEALRPYWAAHEIIEFTEIGIDAEGRCSQAEETILRLLPEDLRDAYITRRLPFFVNLQDFFRADIEAEAGNYTPDDLKEAERVYQYLTLLQKFHNAE